MPRSTLENNAPKLCNVARGHNFSVLIETNSQYLFCYIAEKKKERPNSSLSLTGIFKPVIHNFEKHVFKFFANNYIIFAFLNSLKYVKYKRK